MRFLLLVSFVLLAGCDFKTPVINPPIFARGDTVKLHDSDTLGIVIGVSENNHKWYCNVMFADTCLEYEEKLLILHKHPEWHVKPSVDPEVDGKNFQTP